MLKNGLLRLIIVAVLASTGFLSVSTLLSQPAKADCPPGPGFGMLRNTGFEEGFYNIGGTWNNLPLQVGNSWILFNLRASANWMDTRVYARGGWVEKVECETSQFVFGTQNYSGGIYQRVNVTPGHTYSFGSALLPMWDRWNEATHKGYPVAFAIYTGIDPYGGTDANSPNIIWSPPSNIDFNWNGKSTMVAAQAHAGTITCFIKIVNPGTDGTYWETVIDGAYLNEAPSATLSVMPYEVDKAVVSWSGTTTSDPVAGNAAIKSFDIQYRDGPQGVWVDWITDSLPPDHSATFRGSPNHTYYFRARMVESYPPGMQSISAYRDGDGDAFIVFDHLGPQAGFTTSLPAWINTPTLALAWTATDLPAPGSGISRYVVQANDNGGGWQTILDGMATAMNVPVQNGHTYRFRVQAIDGVGNVGGWSESGSTGVDTLPPSNASISTASTHPAKSYFVVSWAAQDSGSGIASYDLDVDSGSGFQPWYRQTTARQSLWVGKANQVYRFRVRATDRAGNTMPDYSPVLTVTAGSDGTGLFQNHLIQTSRAHSGGW